MFNRLATLPGMPARCSEGFVKGGDPETLLISDAGEVAPESERKVSNNHSWFQVTSYLLISLFRLLYLLSSTIAEPVMLGPARFIEPGFVGWTIGNLRVQSSKLVVHRFADQYFNMVKQLPEASSHPSVPDVEGDS